MEEMKEMKIERDELIVEMKKDKKKRKEEGIEKVEYWVRKNKGKREGKMMKVEYGGEIQSLIMEIKVEIEDRG